MDGKACGKCGETKPLTEFHRHSGTADGHSSICKPCAIERRRQWQRDNRAYFAAYKADYRRRKQEQPA